MNTGRGSAFNTESGSRDLNGIGAMSKTRGINVDW